MIKVSVIVQDLKQLEGLVAQLTVLDLKLGGLTVVPDEGPAPRSQPRKERSTRSRKRRSSNMSIKVATLTRHVPPLMERGYEALKKEFGDEPFRKGLAAGVIQRALKMKSRPTAHVSTLLDAGGLVQV